MRLVILCGGEQADSACGEPGEQLTVTLLSHSHTRPRIKMGDAAQTLCGVVVKNTRCSEAITAWRREEKEEEG